MLRLSSNLQLITPIKSPPETTDHSPQHILNSGSELPFADGINDGVTYRADSNDTVCYQYYFGWNFNASGKLADKTANPCRDKEQHKRRSDDADIDSCLSFSHFP